MNIGRWIGSFGLLNVLALVAVGNEPPLFEKDRPSWEIKFADVSNSVMSVMPGESAKTFRDPLTGKNVKWEQDVFCPTFTVVDGKLRCVYRAFGDDGEWRLAAASSDDGLHFTRSREPVLYAKPEDDFLRVLGDDRKKGVSYGDAHIMAGGDSNFYLYFNFLHYGNTTNDQQLAVATSRDLKGWSVHGRIFSAEASCDRAAIPERAPWRLPVATVISRLDRGRFVAAKIRGKYWMYFNCYATKGPYCLCMATSDNLLDWKVLRDRQGKLVNPLSARPGRFDSYYTDPVAAVLRDDGILLIYNGVNAEHSKGGDPRLKYYSHYPAQALFDRNDPSRLLKRSTSPFKGGNAELEKQPIVFWCAPVYEAWSLTPFGNELLLYWNHTFGRRAVGLWKAAIPASMLAHAANKDPFTPSSSK
jgi:beta-1,2-mannosidase